MNQIIKSSNICGSIGVIATVYAFFIKVISLQLFIVGLMVFMPGLIELIFPSIGKNGLRNIIYGFLWGMASLWMAIDVHPTHLYFGSKDFTYSLQRIIFSVGFVVFGLGSGILLFIELKNKWKQRKKP